MAAPSTADESSEVQIAIILKFNSSDLQVDTQMEPKARRIQNRLDCLFSILFPELDLISVLEPLNEHFENGNSLNLLSYKLNCNPMNEEK
jgi:hypothetical protein